MLINAGTFLWLCSSYRLVYIAGRFGGGKTSLAVRIAAEIMSRDQKYRLITNTSCVWRERLSDVQLRDDGMLNAVVLLDEGGLYFDDERLIKQVSAYAAKMDCIYLIPSYWEPHRKACIVTVEPSWSLKAAGVPLVCYTWNVRQRTRKDKGWFLWLFPSEVYGLYSRQDPGDTAQEIVRFLVDRTAEFRRFHKREDNSQVIDFGQVPSGDDTIPALAEGRRVTSGLESVLSDVEEAIERFEAVAARATERKRRR